MMRDDDYDDELEQGVRRMRGKRVVPSACLKTWDCRSEETQRPPIHGDMHGQYLNRIQHNTERVHRWRQMMDVTHG